MQINEIRIRVLLDEFCVEEGTFSSYDACPASSRLLFEGSKGMRSFGRFR
jgi:hypothetical protein